MHTIKLCKTANRFSPATTPIKIDPLNLPSFLTQHDIRGEKDGPALVLGTFTDGRKLPNMQQITALGLDLEFKASRANTYTHYETRLNTLLNTLRPYYHLFHTTYSSTPKDIRARVIVPLQRPLTPEDFPTARRWFDSFTDQLSDPQARKPNNLYYLPAAPDSQSPRAYCNNAPFLEIPWEQALQLDKARNTLIGRGYYPRDKDLKAAAHRVTTGEPMAPQGHRDETSTRLMFHIAKTEKELDENTLELLFRTSLDGANYGQKEVLTWDKVYNQYLSAIDKDPQADHNTPRDRTTIVQRDSAYYFKDQAEGGYSRAYTYREASLGSQYHLSKNPEVDLYIPTVKGDSMRRLKVDELCERYGTPASHIVVDLTTDQSHFDQQTGVMYEAPLHSRKLEPSYNKDIDTWLRLLAGDVYPKLVRWLSYFPDLTKTLCALQFEGPPGSGKSLLTIGLARYWQSEAATEPQALTTQFNGGLARCPLVEIDEEFHESKFSGRRLVSILRSELSKTRRELRRKYLPEADLLGSIRCLITGNNNIVSTPGVLNRDGIQAIAERILYMRVPKTATDFLHSVHEAERERWAKDGIAQHVTHLHQNIPAEWQREGRFWVMGETSRMTRILAAVGVKGNALVSEWLTLGLLDRFAKLQHHTESRKHVKLEQGGLFVHSKAIVDSWDVYSTQGLVKPTHEMVNNALKAMALQTSVRFPPDRRMQYSKIDPSILKTWATEYGNISEEIIDETLLGNIKDLKLTTDDTMSNVSSLFS